MLNAQPVEQHGRRMWVAGFGDTEQLNLTGESSNVGQTYAATGGIRLNWQRTGAEPSSRPLS